MNEKFHQLPEEKQLAIFNAAMEVFAQNDYKRASTDDIAAKAGISKGMLFYYFQNKRTLYLETYDYAMRAGRAAIDDPHLFEITDFFELLNYSVQKKLQIMAKMPYLYDFCLRTFYSEKEETSEPLKEKLSKRYLRNLQRLFSQHRPQQIHRRCRTATGAEHADLDDRRYLHMQRYSGNSQDLDAMMEEFSRCAQLLKKAVYKELINESDPDRPTHARLWRRSRHLRRILFRQ